MSGSAGHLAHRHPTAAEGNAAASGRTSSRLAELAARESFVAIVFALAALALTARPADHVRSDTWLALVGGRTVWQHWLPHHDTLTVWAHGHTWIDQQWLAQLAFYGLHAAGGLRLVLMVHTVVLLVGFALAFAFARLSGGSARSVALVGILALFVAIPNSTARAQTFAYLFFVALFWLLAANVERPRARVLLALPLLVVWANVHGSAVIGAALVVLWALAQVIRLRVRRDPDAWRARLRLVAFGVAAALCLLVSPYGTDVVGYYHTVLGSGAFRQLVTEWKAPSFSDNALFFVLAVVAVWLTARKPRALSLFEHLVLVILLFAAFDAVRNILWFALVTMMVAPRALDAAWPVGEAPLRRTLNIALTAGAAGLVIVSFAAAASRPHSAYERGYPPAAADAVGSIAARDPSARIFANETFADWLLWKAPALAGRVAFDARLELLTNRQLHEIAHFRNQSSTSWKAAADGYRVLVLDPHTERSAIRAIRAEQGTQSRFRNADVAVLVRSPRP